MIELFFVNKDLLHYMWDYFGSPFHYTVIINWIYPAPQFNCFDSINIIIFSHTHTVLLFGFDPAEYEFREGSGENFVSVSLLSGNLGEFNAVLTIATDGDSLNATAEGEYIQYV